MNKMRPTFNCDLASVTMAIISNLSVFFGVLVLSWDRLTVHAQNAPIVTVSQGSLQGAVDTLHDGTSYYSFRGIPYAEPPVGSLRFLAPRGPQPWEGTRNATAYGSVCAQTDTNTGAAFTGSEDCLFLNVFTRSLDQPKAVMVYIHGGNYFSGSGNDNLYGPKFLLQQDVVLVTLNYRLEVLGFLNLDTPEVPGNAGMKDQVAALKWVKENIAKFGGDPDNITLFGESSGACSVIHHMTSPLSEGLFNKVIAQSGTSLHDWALSRNSKDRAFRVGKYLGTDTTDTTELLEFLRGLPAATLTNVTSATSTEDERLRDQPEQFLPVVEQIFDNVEAFLTENPIDSVISKKTRQVPLLLGYNSAEAMLMLPNRLAQLDFYNQNPSFDVPRKIADKVTQEQMTDLGKRIRNFYVGDREFTTADFNVIVKMFSDRDFLYDIHRLTYLYSQYNSPIYMYKFSFETDLNIIRSSVRSGLSLDLTGACHGDDVFYLFSNSLNNDLYVAQDELKAYVSQVTKLWADFAKGSNPTPDAEAKWPTYTSDNKEYFNINVTSTSGLYADKESIEFWDSLYCEVGLPCIKNN